MLYYIREIKERGLVTNVPDFPVYVDSPLAVEATEVFKKNQADCFSGEALELVKANAKANFDETIECHIRTGCD